MPQCRPSWLSGVFAVVERLDGIVLRERRVRPIRDAVERASWDGLMEALRGHPVLLAETFADPAMFAGTCYRAADWTEIGETRGFGRDAGGWREHGCPKTAPRPRSLLR